MNRRIAKKITECKSSLYLDDSKVQRAKQVLVACGYCTMITSGVFAGVIMCSRKRKGLR